MDWFLYDNGPHHEKSTSFPSEIIRKRMVLLLEAKIGDDPLNF